MEPLESGTKALDRLDRLVMSCEEKYKRISNLQSKCNDLQLKITEVKAEFTKENELSRIKNEVAANETILSE